MITIGNQIITSVQRADPKVVELFRDLPSSNINDEMNRLYCMHDYMKLLNPQKARQLLGTAITVKAPIGDNLFFHRALDMAQPGDIIVVDGASGCNRSLAGEIMMRYACRKGLAGIVVDGCLRDLDGIQNLEMPVYAKGITPQGPWKFGPGEINVPIACGGQVVFPGDILVGDADGIVVVRRAIAEEVAQAAQAKKASENRTFARMESDLQAYSQQHQDMVKQWFGTHSPALLSAYPE